MNVAFVNGKILDMTFLDHFVDGGPDMGVQIFVARGVFDFQTRNPRVTLGRLLSQATGQHHNPQHTEEKF